MARAVFKIKPLSAKQIRKAVGVTPKDQAIIKSVMESMNTSAPMARCAARNTSRVRSPSGKLVNKSTGKRKTARAPAIRRKK